MQELFFAFTQRLAVSLVACSDSGGGSTTAGLDDGSSGGGGNPPATAGGTAPEGAATGGGASEGGTSSSGGAETNAPRVAHGLSERPALADFALSLEGGGDGGYRLVPVYPELGRFSEALHAAPVPGQDRIAVIERFGEFKVFDDDPAVSETETVLDLSPKVNSSSAEQGLLGFAFDPRFTENRFVYFLYTAGEEPSRSVVSRALWDAATDRIDPNSERALLQITQPFKNHNGGALQFGPDAHLYVSLGDGGDGGDPRNYAQDLSVLLGKVLRIDVHPADPNEAYDIPPDNPFVGVEGARPEIYALGFRNPYRFTFDRQSGELWVGDVGQNELEEISIVESGGNYGWRVYEGTALYNDSTNTLPESAFAPPVHEYGHDEGLAVIGGYVYRGNALESLFGRYLFADFTSGTVWALERDGERYVDEAIATIEQPTGFVESRDGEVMVISRYDGLFRFEPVVAANARVPAKLSETGLFTDTGSLTPSEGLIAYRPAHPFWSDGTHKRRWLGIPDGERIGFSADDWTFPLGSVSVKHFEIERIEGDPDSRRRLETRVLLHTREGWRGYSYHWDDDQLDATLANERRTEALSVRLSSGEVREQLYEYPSRADCMACHTRVEGFLLGPKTAQFNADFAYPDGVANQLATFEHVSLFDREVDDVGGYDAFAPLDDDTRGVEARARAYLDVNCSSCHQPGGPAPTAMDLRADTPVEAMNVVGVAPNAGDLGIAGARIVASGDKSASVLWQRLRRTDEARMPPLSTHVVDEAGVELIGRWIDEGP